MEMNTRLQVEHPVTEMITGVDLVEWQFRVACGEPLPRRQEELTIAGHAIEARIYAEDPDRGFLPSVGTLIHLRAPATGVDVRVDTGVRASDEISPFYDPMIAKLIVHGEDRDSAVQRLGQALAEYEIVGVASNVAFLARVVAHDAFATAKLDTGLIARHHAALFPPLAPLSARALLTATLAEVVTVVERAAALARSSADPHSPWGDVDPWWPNSRRHALVFTFGDGDLRHRVAVRKTERGWRVALPPAVHAAEVDAAIEARDGRLSIIADGAAFAATVIATGDERHVFCAGAHRKLVLIDPLAHAGEEEAGTGHLRAPMSGTVVAVMVSAGHSVEKGAALMILEAMKMEHTIAAPARGIVTAVNFGVGERVSEGADLLDIDVA
jgi:3-methylcrotonyl-CoA carboxylase alpha subunit